MPTSKLINYTTRDFMSDNELELYAKKQDEIFTPKVIEEFKKAGMLRRVLTRIWNKEGVARVGILFEYWDEKAFVACQTLLDKYHAPQVKTFVNKVVGSRGIVLHEFTSEDFNWTLAIASVYVLLNLCQQARFLSQFLSQLKNVPVME